MAGPDPILAGVAGWPVSHSLSPLIHNTWAARAGIPGYYVPLAVEPFYDAFARAMDAARTLGFRGVNVTIPHKEHALKYAAAASGRACAAGAANMLTFNSDGALADNSDIAGFIGAVREQSSVSGTTALVLGAGGAARGVTLARKELGFEEIVVANRTRAKADELAEGLGAAAIDWDDRDQALAGADLIVNTTSLGMSGEPPLALSLDAARAGAIIADIVYAPLETALLKDAKTRGLRTVDGLAMLIHQAVPAFESWFGARPQADAHLRALLTSALKVRGR